MKSFLGALYTCTLLVTLTASAQAVQYRMVDLGYGRANGINNKGQVVGVGNGQGFLWQNDVMQYLNTAEGTYNEPMDINNNGQMVGGYSYAGSGTKYAFSLNYGSTLQVLGHFGEFSSIAYGINDSGDIVGYVQVDRSTSRGYIWQGGVGKELMTSGDYSSPFLSAMDINNNGQVVGRATYISTKSFAHAFIWQNGVTQDLGDLGWNTSEAVAVNANGQVIGDSYTPDKVTHGFIWQNGSTIRDLGTLGGKYSYAREINIDGQVVGTAETDVLGIYHAFLWQDGIMQDLGTLGGSSQAWGINDNGWIVGESRDADGKSHAVIWQPIPVPEPSSILTLLCGIGTLGGFAIKRRRN